MLHRGIKQCSPTSSSSTTFHMQRAYYSWIAQESQWFTILLEMINPSNIENVMADLTVEL